MVHIYQSCLSCTVAPVSAFVSGDSSRHREVFCHAQTHVDLDNYFMGSYFDSLVLDEVYWKKNLKKKTL